MQFFGPLFLSAGYPAAKEFLEPNGETLWKKGKHVEAPEHVGLHHLFLKSETTPKDVGASWHVSACVFCACLARDTEPKTTNKIKETFAEVERLLGTGELPAELECMTIAEQRLVALLYFNDHPDFFKGPGSVAGRLTKPNAEGTTTPELGSKFTFEFRSIELLGFPTLFPLGRGEWRSGSNVTWRHYMLLRLHSISSKWRQNSDFVRFVLFKSIAMGVLPDDPRFHEGEYVEFRLE